MISIGKEKIGEKFYLKIFSTPLGYNIYTSRVERFIDTSSIGWN